MSLPAKLKNFNVFNDGESYLGLVPELTLPKLSRKTEEYRASGMTGPVEIDFGNEVVTLEWTAGGIIKNALKQYGKSSHDGVQLRFSGGYQNDDGGEVTSVEIVVRGRHKEIDFGNAKITEDTAIKFITTCSYYKLTIDGEDIIELDFINGTEIIGGTDNSAMRTAIGL